MKITKVQIKDFRGIDSLELDFTGPDGKPLDLVVLAGPNGCGKTSVLEACLLMLGWPGRPGRPVSVKSNTRLGCSNFELRLSLLDNDQRPHLLVQAGDQFEHHFEGNVFQTRSLLGKFFAARAGIDPFEYFSSRRTSQLPGSLPLMVGRKKDNQSQASEDTRLRAIKTYLIGRTAITAFRPDEQHLVQPPGYALFARISNAWATFYPDREDHFLARPADDASDDNIVFDVYLKDEKRGYEIPVDALSSGELEIFTMLGWFAIRNLSHAIVFIDEPELHLHPAWHRAILRALRTVLPGTQIICATHSVEMLDSVYSYERFTILPLDDPRIRLTQHQPDVGMKS